MAETEDLQSVTGVVPYLTVPGAAAAIDFYKRAFAAAEVSRVPGEGGKLMHAHLRINDGDVFMSDDFTSAAKAPPQGVTLHLQVDDADVWWKRAIDAGAKVKMELADQFWGDRYGQILDPFGHSWSIASAAKK